jgi:hypothetical protein
MVVRRFPPGRQEHDVGGPAQDLPGSGDIGREEEEEGGVSFAESSSQIIPTGVTQDLFRISESCPSRGEEDGIIQSGFCDVLHRSPEKEGIGNPFPIGQVQNLMEGGVVQRQIHKEDP